MSEIILASASPRRKKLLKNLGLKFKIVPSSFTEDFSLKIPAKKLARHLSAGKAKVVAKNYPNGTVIGADTIVVHQNKILGKPHTKKEAARMLKILSGKMHTVITGYTIINLKNRKQVSKAVSARVKFRKLSECEIQKYVKNGEPLDKAGAYAIQENAMGFVEKVVGDYTTIIGLPLPALIKDLKKFGVKI